MRKVKCCPKCGSTNVNFLVFYRPSIWRCLDCGYEGALIIEDCDFTEQMQRRLQERSSTIGRTEREPHVDDWDDLTDDLLRI